MRDLKFRQYRVIVELKPIKNMHLAVYPPEGKIRVAAPFNTSMEQINLLLLRRRGWIDKQYQKITTQKRETPREYVYRESHYFKGRKYLLRIHPESTTNNVIIRPKSYLDVYIKLNDDPEIIKKVLNKWYRERLREEIQDILKSSDFGIPLPKIVIREMKRKWGSYSKKTHTVTLNLELIKKPSECIEYVVLHELMHYFENTHNPNFISLLDTKMPDWKSRRDLLNRLPLSN